MTVNTYPRSNYSFWTKQPKHEKVGLKDDRLARMRKNYAKDGVRRTVEGILLECHKLYIVHLSEKEYFGVRENYKIVAVPLFTLHNKTQGYGTVLSSIPRLLSRFQFLPRISPGRT